LRTRPARDVGAQQFFNGQMPLVRLNQKTLAALESQRLVLAVIGELDRITG
jgi:hypothetical protein